MTSKRRVTKTAAKARAKAPAKSRTKAAAKAPRKAAAKSAARPAGVAKANDATALARARRFVDGASLPRPRATTARGVGDQPSPVDVALEVGHTQAAVVGSEIVSFVDGVTPERREAIVNSSMLAQLVAKQRVSDPSKVYEWYDVYFDVLSNIGWVVQDRTFARYDMGSQNLEAHEAILAVATTLLGAAPAALAVVKSTLDALKSMNAGSPWITIFSRESQHAETARFQISLAEQDPAGGFFVTLMAFGLEAKSSITQVLFFKIRRNEATLRHYSGKVTINTTVLDGVREAIREKLTGQATDFVKALPALG